MGQHWGPAAPCPGDLCSLVLHGADVAQHVGTDPWQDQGVAVRETAVGFLLGTLALAFPDL